MPGLHRARAAPTTNEKFKLFMFFLYTIIYEAAVWGLWYYLFTTRDLSGWSVIIAIMMSGAQLKPRSFGLDYNMFIDDDDDEIEYNLRDDDRELLREVRDRYREQHARAQEDNRDLSRAPRAE